MMPAQRPHRSRQDYGTPGDLLDAVFATFGPLRVDLAASPANAVAPAYFDEDDDSLAQDWTTLHGTLWLNPPFARIGPWAAKCAASAPPDTWPRRRIIMLTPASVGSRWFVEHVHRRALVLALVPRLTFVGCDAPYPKDCMLSIFGGQPGFNVWEWREATA